MGLQHVEASAVMTHRTMSGLQHRPPTSSVTSQRQVTEGSPEDLLQCRVADQVL